MSDFIHLRVHSAYSMAEGAIRIAEDKPKDGGKAARDDLMTLCTRFGMPAVALTDKGNLFGALEFALAASARGIQPIIGCEIAVSHGNDESKRHNIVRSQQDKLVVLVQDEAGYRNLSWLVSHSFTALDRELPFVTLEEIASRSGGLFALTAGTDGRLARLLHANKKNEAENYLHNLQSIFKGNIAIELNRHKGEPCESLQQAVEESLISMADNFDLPLVATNDVYFGTAAMHTAHDALICIADKQLVAESDRRRFTADHYFKSASSMRNLFSDIPDACSNTVAIARSCAFMPRARDPIMPAFPTTSGRSEAEELKAQAQDGLKNRFLQNNISATKPYEERLAFEIEVIVNMGFAGYFLIVSDFILYAKKNNIPVGPGRGSGAGSVVAWSLCITDLDPLRFGLLFERFLNPERVSMPDFDVDFCQARRDEVISYVQERYGSDRVAQIITFGKLQARAALRDVGRVLGMPYGYIDKICKMVPNNPANPLTLEQAINSEPQLKTLKAEDPSVAELMDIAQKLEGLYRNASTHAAGVVIGDRPLVELVPLYRDHNATLPATQFNMKMVETAGLVKFDFLGLKTLDVLQQAVDMLKSRGALLDLAALPLDDEKTFNLLSAGDTTGVFQLESAGMRDILRRMKPSRFEDIIALVALYRPGPMDNIPSYIACKNGEEMVRYLHPDLEPVLQDTFGIMIYQEQVMQAAQVLAGYSLGGADLLRRAMGKKKPEEMAAQKANFVEGAARRGINADQARLIFEQIDKFAGYGFNKSHAAAYALISWQTAYLKANYPVEFFAASMNLEISDTDKLSIYRGELSRHGIAMLPPDINRSGALFQPSKTENGGNALRYALAALKGVSDAAMQDVVAARQSGGDFKDLYDMIERVPRHALSRKQLESLAMAGALDSLNSNRAQIIGALDSLIRHGSAIVDERTSGQMSIFGDVLAKSSSARPPLPDAKPWGVITLLANEMSVLGFYMSAHPLDGYRAFLRRMKVIAAQDIDSIDLSRTGRGTGKTCVAGIVMRCQERTARSGNRFAFLQIADISGTCELMIFAELLAKSRDMLEVGTALFIEVNIQEGERGDRRVMARSIERLDALAAAKAEGLLVKVNNESDIKAVQDILSSVPKGRWKVSIKIAVSDAEEATVKLPGAWAVTPELRESLAQCGSGVAVEFM